MCEVHTIAASYDFGDMATNNKVRFQRSFPISTIERLYDDLGFRNHLNFEFDQNGKINIKSSRKSFDEEFKKVILASFSKNVGDKIDTRILNTEESRRKYYESRLKKLKGSGRGTKSSEYKPKPAEKGKQPKTIGVFDRSLKCTIKCKGIERVFSELQSINYGDGKFPNAAHDLMRSFLEAVLKEYLQKKNHTIKPRQPGGYIFLKDVLREAEIYFKNRNNHQMKQVVIEVKQDKALMDAINHNPSVFSTRDKVRDSADTMSDLIKFIFTDCK